MAEVMEVLRWRPHALIELPRWVAMALMFGPWAMILVLWLAGVINLRSVLVRITMIATEEDLAVFRAMAARDMYLALVCMLLQAVAFIGAVVGGCGGHAGLAEWVGWGACLIATSQIGAWTLPLQQRLYQLPCYGPNLSAAHAATVDTWRYRPLPDW